LRRVSSVLAEYQRRIRALSYRQGLHAQYYPLAYDTYALANGTGKAVVKAGGDSWFLLTADYAFGRALQRDTTAVVEANGGKVLGRVNVPLNSPDFSSFLCLCFAPPLFQSA
jgi:ABC-type branched-subunit amino acid transport system substrate-binding protein